jgi:hypothetical protein
MNVKVSAKDMDDFIWMSYRYCIGRKTIAASCHAGTIAELIFNNPKLLSKDRIEQMVTDIRNEIQDTIKWNKFIKFENEYSYSACMYDSTWDVYSAILTADTEFPNETQYIADFSTRTVKCEKFSKEDTMGWHTINAVKVNDGWFYIDPTNMDHGKYAIFHDGTNTYFSSEIDYVAFPGWKVRCAY